MTKTKIDDGALRMTEDQWRTLDDFRKHWDAFCDCDTIPIDREDFADRLESEGYIEVRAVTKEDIESTPFASELGIELGGSLWALTEKGRSVLSARSSGGASDAE